MSRTTTAAIAVAAYLWGSRHGRDHYATIAARAWYLWDGRTPPVVTGTDVVVEPGAVA